MIPVAPRLAQHAKHFDHLADCIQYRLFLGAVAMAAAVSPASANTIAAKAYVRQPVIQGDNLVFVSEGDLWRANLAKLSHGKPLLAQRLTTHLAEESLPRISNDGQLVAFSARYEGPSEVYVMPINGGLPTRLTYEGDNARVQGFASNGHVLYSTARWSGKPEQRMFSVNPVSRQVTALPLAEAAEGCYLGSSFIFTRKPQTGDNVKNYRGGLVQQLWRFDGKSEASVFTGDYLGTSRQPMCGANRVYFLSDRDGTVNIWSVSAVGADARQHTRHQNLDIRSAAISADGKRIVYQRGADAAMLDTASGSVTDLEIHLQSDFEHTRTRWVKNVWDYVTTVEPSPTGDRVAITARGEIFVLPVGNGRRIELQRNAGVRARDAVFAADGKSVLAFTDVSGEFELTQQPANGVGSATQITRDATVQRRRIYPSPNGKWIAHDDISRKLYLTDVASAMTRAIDESADSEHKSVIWSPDSRYLVFSKQAKNQFDQLFLLEVATGKLTPLSSDRYDARDAAFTPDGNWLYFIGNRNLQSVVPSPWGQRNPQPFFDRQSRIYAYRLAADANVRWPFLPKDELQPSAIKADAKPDLAAPKPADGKASAIQDAAKSAPALPFQPISLANLLERLFEVPMPVGNYRELSTDGKRLYFLSLDSSDRKTALRSIAIESPNPQSPSVELFMEDIRSYRMTQDRKKLMVRRQNDVFVFDAAKSAPPPAEQAKHQVITRDWALQLDPRQEWAQMFVDAWRMHRDYFYDRNMHGVDWSAARKRYQPLVARANDRAEVNDVIAQMVSEVRALHSQVGGADLRAGQDNIDIAGLGIDTIKTADGFQITHVHGGDPELIEERSPVARAEVNLKVGDNIVAVNGVKANDAATMGELLRNQADRQVLLSVKTESGLSRDVIVLPVAPRRERELRYLSWERERMQQVDTLGQGRIGYVHLQAMGANDIARWAREFYPVYQRDGLIIDLRHNNGGNIDSWIIEKLQRRVWHFWQSRRSTTPLGNQQVTFRGHVVALIDANTYSDGETLAQGLRRLGIAPLVGMTTAGAGIWLSDQNRLRDNGIARAAEFGSYVDNGKERAWITEGVGVKPDVEVDNLPFATFKGEDAQLARAIKMLQDKIAREPIPAPVVPAFPRLAKP